MGVGGWLARYVVCYSDGVLLGRLYYSDDCRVRVGE